MRNLKQQQAKALRDANRAHDMAVANKRAELAEAERLMDETWGCAVQEYYKARVARLEREIADLTTPPSSREVR